MAKRKEKKLTPARPQLGDNVEILSAGEVLESAITDTLETNYMPYAMSVIVSRALPEIDGFKPAHRKLLYTMYEMGLLKGNRTKSANIVGSTMHLNPHGDAAIYDTMVRMGRSNESLLVPFVDSKGNFGKAYSRDMAYAAAVTPRPSSSRSATSCSATSTRTPSILCPTTTARRRSRRCCPSPSRRFWPTTRWASPSAWRPTSAPSTSRNSAMRRLPDEGPAGRFAGNRSGP